MNQSRLGENLGFIFELGFNIGLLTFVEQKQIKHNYQQLYRQDLRQLNLAKIIRKLINNEKVISEQHREIIKQWVDFFFRKSFLSGLNFLEEYFISIGWNYPRKQQRLEIIYFQCCLCNNNSIGTYEKESQKVYQEWLSQLNNPPLDTITYSKTGEFLNADTLVLFRYKNQVRILVIDYSIFAIKSIQDFSDLNNVEVLRQILLSDIKHLKSKSVFANLGIDSQDIQFPLSESLSGYYKAFIRTDKETLKLIQAGSYAYSFWNWLQTQTQIQPEDEVIFNIIGYSDRDMASLCLNQHNLDVLQTCYKIYKNKQNDTDTIHSRQQVLNVIKRKFKRSFDNGETFINKLWEIDSEGIHMVSHTETLSQFTSYLDRIPQSISSKLNLQANLNLQQAHGELIKRALSKTDDNLYLFLTGNPGIGKTTAISDFLKQPDILNEGFLFFYISPRTQVNLDIVEKFTEEDTKSLCDNRLITVNSNSNLIKRNSGKLTVQYRSNIKQERFNLRGVDFIPDSENIPFVSNNQNSIDRYTNTRLRVVNSNSKGVLNSLCEGIYNLLQENHNNIVATVAIQSLRQLQGSQTTLDNFKSIFRDVYNRNINKPIESKLKQLSHRIKHIFIAIDEITGDRSGVDFLVEISRILKQYGLDNPNYFNTKVIVADASIVDSDIIKQHLQSNTSEPNKIFFRKAKELNNVPLSVDNFLYYHKKATAINTNSYPAKNILIRYKIFVQSLRFNQHNYKIFNEQKYDLEEQVNQQIIKDIKIIRKIYPEDQIIVYIQDKKRLSEIIQYLQQKRIIKQKQDYLAIHGDLSFQEKQEVHERKNQVAIVFMTASASRGLSFPQTKHILVDIPRFEIEANLMEIIQVIYRGRGNKNIDTTDKELVFYLREQAVYYMESNQQRSIAIGESKLNLLNILIVIQTAIKTRIYGYGEIANEKYMMIPVGGKSIISAGESLSNKIAQLIRSLKKEHQKHSHDTRLEQAYKHLEELMKSTEITLSNFATKSQELPQLSYLQLADNIRQQFTQKIEGNLEALLELSTIQKGYIQGNLLIIPIPKIKVEETYRLKLQDKTVSLQQILNQLQQDSYISENIQSLIKDTLELIEPLSENLYQTQQLEQVTNYLDQYYLIPLFAFINNNAIAKFFEQEETEPEDQRFRDILAIYLRSLYPISQVIPIGYKYADMPFLVFRSHSLKEIRSKNFSDKYLINSSELNILSLILSS